MISNTPKNRVIALILASLCFVVVINYDEIIVRPSSWSRSATSTTANMQTLDHQLDFLFRIRPRPFKRWDMNRSLPCYGGGLTLSSKMRQGFFFVKIPKCASTTGASVTLRVANNVGAKRLGLNKNNKKKSSMCRTKTNHDSASSMNWETNSSFVWSLLREPISRSISHFFFTEVSRKGKLPSDANFKSFLHARRNFTNFYISRLSKETNRTEDVAENLNSMLESYNFLGIAERMDESIVALQMILGLETSDVLYLSSKRNGQYDDGRINNTCHLIQKSEISPTMREYFSSPEYKRSIYNDELVYQAINKSLDLTIEELGYEMFNVQLKQFQNAKEKIDIMCSHSVRFPCTETGEKRAESQTDCVLGDWGCGFKCIDKAQQQQQQQPQPSSSSSYSWEIEPHI